MNMCSTCEDLLVALEAIDANLGTLILARRTVVDRIKQVEGNHTSQTSEAPTEAHTGCQHPDDRLIKIGAGTVCDVCGGFKAKGTDEWVMEE